jgi:hypothetical protein
MMPRADDVCSFETDETRCPPSLTPWASRVLGEAGNVGDACKSVACDPRSASMPTAECVRPSPLMERV